MDNDDNDSQNQNHHLASEGNNKFPPVLLPYALPGFDFDDNLHGGLKFDSLVETEVFLDIERSEDNQWIEDFSRGSTGIAFSSSAAESCSISMRNNVWSEAASSESVEMLLKSVGQDETIPVQTISKGSDACDELGCMINQMESSLTHGDSGLSKVGDDLQPALQSGECPGKFSGLKDDVGDHQLVEDVSQLHEYLTSVDGALEDLNTRNTDLPVTEVDESKECIVVNENLVEASIDQSVDKTGQENKCCSDSQVDTVVPSVQNTHAISASVDSQDATHLKNNLIDEDVKSLARGNIDMSQEVQSDGENLSENAVASVTSLAQKHSALDMQSKEDVHAVGNIATADEPVDMILKGNSDLHMVEGCIEGMSVESPLQTGISEDIVLSEGKLHDISPMPFVDDDLQPALQSGECPGKFSGLKDEVGEHQLVEDVSQRHESVHCVLEALNTRNTDLPMNEIDESNECIVVSENLVEASIDQSVDKMGQENKCCSNSQVDTVVPSVQNTHAISASVDSQDATHLKNDLIDEDVKSLARENVDMSQEVQSDGENLSENAVASVTSLAQKHSALDMQSKEDVHAVGNIDTADEPVDRILKGSSDLHMVEGCSEGMSVESPLQTGISEDIVLSEGKLHDISPMLFVGDDLQPALQLGECPGTFSGLIEDAGDHLLVEDVSRRHESVDCIPEALNTRNTDLPMTEIDESKECIVVSENLVEGSIDQSVDKMGQENKCCSDSQVDTVVPSVQNAHAISASVDSQDAIHLKNNLIDEDVKSLARGNIDMSQEVQSDDENLSENAVASVTSLAQKHSALDMQSKEDVHAVGNIATADEPVDRILRGSSDLHMVEGCSEGMSVESPLRTGISEDIVLSEGKLHDISPMPFVGDDLQPALQSGECPGKFSGLKDDVGDHQLVDVSQRHESVDCVLEALNTRNTDLPMTEIDESKECIVVSENLVEASIYQSVDKTGQENKCYSGSQVDTVVPSVQNTHSISALVDSQDATHLKNDLIDEDVKSLARENVDMSQEVQSDVENLSENAAASVTSLALEHSALDMQSKEDGHAVGNIATADEPVDSILKENSDLHMVEGCSEVSVESPPRTGISEDIVLSEGKLHDISPMPFVGDASNTDMRKSTNLESNMGSMLHIACDTIEKKNFLESDCHLDMKILNTRSEKSVVDDNDSKGGSEGSHNTFGAEPMKDCEECIVPEHNDDYKADQSGSAAADQNTKLSSDCGNTDCADGGSVPVIKGFDSFSGTGATADELASNLQSGVAVSGNSSDHAKTHNSSFPSAPSSVSQTKIHTLESGSSITVLDNPSCRSPIIIRTSEQSPSKIEKNGVKGSNEKSSSVSGVINGEENKEQSVDVKGNDASPVDGTFTFEVTPLASKKEAGKKRHPFSSMQHETVSSVVDGTPSTSSLCEVDTKAAQEISHANLQATKSENTCGRSKGVSERSGSKGTSERRTRRVGGKSANKEATKKGIITKEITPASRSKRSDRTSNASLSSAGISQVMQSNEIQHRGQMEGGNVKPFGVLSTLVSSLPDLNNSASSSAAFHQPFKDMQQVQLRAQIYVYGALNQGTVPDEAYMISAFGGPDGGRTIWENVWRACIDREQSHLVSPETPLQMHLGARTSDQSIKQNAVQNKITSPASRSASKGTPTTVVNPMIPLSSPLWSISTPCGALQPTGIPRSAVMDYEQALSPWRPPPIRNFVGHSAPWMSQSPFRVPWVPQTSSFDGNARFPVIPTTETVNLTPVREASVLHSSAMKQVSTVPMVQSGSPANVFAGTPLLDTKKATTTRGQHSAGPKPRKRKKSTVSEDPEQIILPSQTESVSPTVMTSSASTPAAITTPTTIVSKSSTNKFITSASADHLEKGERDSDQRVALSEDTFGKLQEAQKQAEDASALAAVAVQHSQEMWNQLGKHKDSRLEPDLEAELTSAAAVIAAAAAVAKAAAAAAKVASNAALQAKLMGDEALVLSGAKNFIPTNAIASDNVKNLGKATPASILKDEDATTSSNSVIIAAREAARRRVAAASAVSMQAENMDAIVKAAELAAEAVSQAGKIVAMGEPFSLTELVEAGPEAYWKVPEASPEPNGASGQHIDKVGSVEGPASSARYRKEVQVDKREKPNDDLGMSPTSREIAGESLENHSRLTGGILSPAATSGKDIRGQKGRKVSDTSKTKGVTSESDIGFGPSSMITQTEHGEAGETSKNNNLREGSCVEVLREVDGLKVAWFLADILDLKDGKAYVRYNELRSEDGDKLKEWVEFEGEGDGAPRIRTARPITAMQFEGTRKRRRAAMGDYNWSVGDRVDTWMQDSWWEGVVTEKNQKDETSFTVHFPARGETSVVKAWLLRPSLTWKNDSWVEWSSSRDNNVSSHEGDTPREKRQRIDNPVVEAKGEDKLSKSFDLKESWKPDDTSEKIFNIGKSTRDESKPASFRTIRTGLKKEGSRVIFGVPKPGKKFMEVNKHYDADQSSKTHETSDSAKCTKYLMPHGSEPYGTKSKIEPRDKQTAVYKPKVLKSGKLPSVSSRVIPKVSLSNNVVTESGDAAAADGSHTEKISGKRKMTEFRSFSSSDGAAKGPFLFSSKAIPSDAPPKKTSTSSAKSGRIISKPKLASAAGKLAKIEETSFNGNSTRSISELEPRRSNRRIQPTSRLLEGIQSSLTTSKIPSFSHKIQSRGARGNNQG